jgi:hypothetical protein
MGCKFMVLVVVVVGSEQVGTGALTWLVGFDLLGCKLLTD